MQMDCVDMTRTSLLSGCDDLQDSPNVLLYAMPVAPVLGYGNCLISLSGECSNLQELVGAK